MGSNATASTAAASGALAGALVVILVWLVSLARVTVPSDVVAALTVIAGAGLHAGWLRFAFPADPVETPAIVPGNPAPVVAAVKAQDAPAA